MRSWIGVVALATVVGTSSISAQNVHELTVVNIEFEGTKVWVPSTIVARKGDRVKIKLINNVKSDPNQHGFAIAAVNVAEVVTRGEPKTIEFTAAKEGVFPITCQLHPAHVGGQLVVLP
jgi:nitrosocyanin